MTAELVLDNVRVQAANLVGVEGGAVGFLYTYADVCWRMLTHADVCSVVLPPNSPPLIYRRVGGVSAC